MWWRCGWSGSRPRFIQVDRDFLTVEHFVCDEDHLLSRGHFLLVPLGGAGLAELKQRYAGRVEFGWKLALMDASGLPASRHNASGFTGAAEPLRARRRC